MTTLLDKVLAKIKPGNSVLFLRQGSDQPEGFMATIERIQAICGPDGKVRLDQCDRVSTDNHQKASYDYILSNILTPTQDSKSNQSLAVFLSLLKPSGQFVELSKVESSAGLESELKLNGFKSVAVEAADALVMIQAEKPSFEVGAASRLKFSKPKPAAAAAAQENVKVWKFSADDINEDDLINTDDLLDDLDLKKPEVQVRDCGTGSDGKKKACKNCVCGLAEELESEASGEIKKNQASAPKSSCGSCFLGDAFRCASCPYLGMPAFKPGEKVSIGESLLKADV